jgi:diacylglycerol O-acyltransferase
VSEQLSGMDSAFLAMESAEAPMHVVGVLVLQPAAGRSFSMQRLHEVIADRVPLMPPFCRRLIDVPMALDKPYWHYDTSLDLTAHVFDAQLAAPGDLRALGDLVGEIASSRLDRSRPLWELHIVGGLTGDRVAIVAKVHHSTLYGAAGAEFIAELLDLTPESPDRPEVVSEPPLPVPTRRTMTGRAVMSQLRTPLSAGRLLARAGRASTPAARALSAAIGRHGRSALPPAAPKLPISGAPTARRSAAFGALSLERVREVKNANGVTLNELVLATVALALRRYLVDRDMLPDRPVVAGVPVNLGEGVSSGTNSLATMLVALPVDIDDAAELIQAVHAASVAAKEFTAAIGSTAIAELAEITVPAAMSIVTWLTRSLGLATLQPTLLNLVVSNVAGPPIPLYLAGAQVEAIYPMGPLLTGAGMNITVLSNLDRLDVGIMACPDLVEDPWSLAESLEICLEELAKATVA